PGAPGGKEPATPHPRLPQRAGDRTCRGDRTAPPGGRPPCPAAIGGQPRRGRRALRVRQRRGAAPRLPSSPARDPVRLPRPLLVSLALICAGVAFTSQMSASWQLLLTWGVLVGLGTGTTAMVLGATVVNRWFVRRRGAVMGALTASTATGQMLFLPLEAHV